MLLIIFLIFKDIEKILKNNITINIKIKIHFVDGTDFFNII